MIENIKKKLIDDYGYEEITEPGLIFSLFGNKYTPAVSPVCLCSPAEGHSLLVTNQGGTDKWLLHVVVQKHKSPPDPISYLIPRSQGNEDPAEIIKRIALLEVEGPCISDLLTKHRTVGEGIRRELINFISEENPGFSIYHNQEESYLDPRKFLVVGDDLILIEEFGIPSEPFDISSYKLIMCIKKSLSKPTAHAMARCSCSDSWKMVIDYDNQDWSEWTPLGQARVTIEVGLLRSLWRTIERLDTKDKLFDA